ncbi:Nuclear pore complex, nup98 component [Globisporangium polare]
MDATSKALRQKQQRRTAGTPYGVAGAARSRNEDSAGMFSRFLKKIPIINQLVGDDEDEEFDGEEEDEDAAGDELFDSDDAMNSEQEDATTRAAAVVVTTESAVEVVEVTFETPATAAAAKENSNSENVAEQPEQTEGVDQRQTEVEGETDDAAEKADDAVVTPKFVNEMANAAAAAFVERGPATPSSKAPSPQASTSKSSPSFAKRPRSPQAELGPVLRSQRRKNSSTQKAFMPVASQKSKALRIGGVPDSPDDEMRRIPRRRVRLASSPMDSPLAVIKHKKTISYEEYERLSLQLRGMVESSPQASLALTQNALNRGFDERPNGSFSYGPPKNLTYVPGTMSLRDSQRGSSPDHDKKTASEGGSSELQLANGGGAPFGKRARLGENRPIYFSGFPLRGQMLTREERVERKPRPSRLLTGAKRDAAARSAYSSAVAEKILSTLNKVQNPLEREAKKPTPQTSLSWAKYHLALTDGTNDDAGQRDDDESMDEMAPPTSTIPRVSFPSSFSQSSNDVTSFQSFTPSPTDTPARKPKLFSTGSTAMSFSPQDVSMTPAPRLSAAAVKQIAVEYGSYSFTVPAHSNSIVWQGKRKAIEDEIEDIQFVFSPPPSQREPPKRVSSQKARKVLGAVETPFSFVPASPKARAEWLGLKPTTQKKPQEVAEKPAVSAPSASSGSVNPLARFAQLAPGQWKCPTCSVSNEAKHAKCPCCETTKPSGSAAPVASSASAAVPVSGFNPLAKFAQLAPGQWKCPTCSVTNEAKQSKCPCCETTKPGASGTSSAKAAEKKSAGTITSSGFSFGVPAASAKPASTEAPKSGGFSFGVTTPVETKSPSSVDDSVPSFTFSAPPVSSEATKPSFSFGAAPDASSSSASKPSFAFSTPATFSSEDKSVASTGFSFGAPATSEKKSETFGVKAAVTTAPSFSFGSSSPVKTVSSSSAMGFSFGADVPKGAASTKSAQESSEPATKKPAFSFGVTEAKKPETTTPAFSFDTAKAAALAKAPESTPSFSFRSSGSAAKPATPEPKPAFSFGAPPSQAGVTTTNPSESKADGKPAFTFGSSSTEKPTSGFGQETSSTSTFGFGQSTTASPPKSTFSFGESANASPPKPAAPAPAFGSSAPSMFGGIAAVTAPSFGAGSAAAPAAPAFGSSSSSAPAAPSFTFGAQSSSAAPATTPAATAQPAFTFGGSSSSSPAAAPAAAPTGFGSTSSSSAFGGSASSTTSTTAGPSFMFGGNASQSSTHPQSSFGFGASASAPASTGFGSSAAPATSGFGSSGPAASGFGAPAASGFGSSAPASSGFGAPATSGFGSSAPASSGFGMSTPAASGFGIPAPAATGFGASTPAQTAFGSSAPASSAFGSAPASSSFGAATPAASGFGGTPASSNTFGASASFGAAPSTAFGAPNPGAGAGFGAQQPSGFGGSSGFGSSGFGGPAATAFGAAGPSAAPSNFGAPSPAFGAPAAAPSSAFGAPGSVGFGAPSSGGFGAAAPSASFGGAPAVSFNPSAASFGAPAGGFGAQEGGFSVGAAPQAGPKRRILKARSKRT